MINNGRCHLNSLFAFYTQAISTVMLTTPNCISDFSRFFHSSRPACLKSKIGCFNNFWKREDIWMPKPMGNQYFDSQSYLSKAVKSCFAQLRLLAKVELFCISRTAAHFIPASTSTPSTDSDKSKTQLPCFNIQKVAWAHYCSPCCPALVSCEFFGIDLMACFSSIEWDPPARSC